MFSFKDFVKCETIFYCFFLNVVILFFLENLKPLLPAGIQDKLHTLIPCRKFDLSYDLNCHKLCSDFQEDIVFRFSLGWSSLVHRFLGPINAQRVLLGLSEPIFQVIFFFWIGFSLMVIAVLHKYVSLFPPVEIILFYFAYVIFL